MPLFARYSKHSFIERASKNVIITDQDAIANFDSVETQDGLTVFCKQGHSVIDTSVMINKDRNRLYVIEVYRAKEAVEFYNLSDVNNLIDSYKEIYEPIETFAVDNESEFYLAVENKMKELNHF